MEMHTCKKFAIIIGYMVFIGKADISGLEIATNTVTFATKISGEVVNLRLVVTFTLSKQKG